MNFLLYKILSFSWRKLRRIFYIRYNRILLFMSGAKFGKFCQVYNKIYLIKARDSFLSIGNHFLFTSGESFNPLCRNIRGCIYCKKGASIIIGNNVGMSSTCLWASQGIKIGDNVKIGGDCILLDTDAHSLNYLKRRDIQGDCSSAVSSPIIIEDDVLIGTRSIILKGVTIGARSIIGSGSIVIKSIPADCIAAGNPCKVIREINN